MSIDFTKPIQTRDGRKVRLLCTDGMGAYPVAVWFEDGKFVAYYTSEGVNIIGEESPIDLMNVPEQVTVNGWVNIYTESCFFSTKEKALELAAMRPWLKRCATLHIKRTVPVGHVDE